MAQSKENQKTFGKTKNSKVYFAGNSNSFDVCDERESDSPRRNSVPLIRSVFESTSSENPAGKPQKSVSVQKGSAKSLSPCSPETKKSSLETVCELKQPDNPTHFHDARNSKSSCEAQNKAPGCVTSNDDLYHSDVKSYASPNTAEKSTNDPCDTNINDGQGSKSSRPGSLRLQPASNVRGPLIKTEYLKLTKFNDITVYHGSKKIAKVSVDELDKKIDDRCFPVAAAADAVAVECVDDDGKGLDDSEDSESHFDSDFVFEFEGTARSVNRPALKTSKSLIKKQVSFSQELMSVFEYPSECDASDSHLTNFDADQETIPKTVASKTLQSNPGCSGAGYLGFYQPRLLERDSVIPYYSAGVLLDCAMAQQSKAIHPQPKDNNLMAKGSAFGSCSAEESSWSGGNSGTELLF